MTLVQNRKGDASSARSVRTTTIALGGTLLLAAAIGIGRFAYTPLLPPMQEALGWTVSQAGDVASANYLGYLVGALIASALAHRRQRWRWLLAGMIVSASTTAAGAAAESFAAWIVVRFFAGVASAFCLVLGTAIVIESLVTRSRPQLGALHFAGVGAGIVASVVVIELARLANLSVYGQWGVLGITAFLLLVGSWLTLRTVADGGIVFARAAEPHVAQRHTVMSSTLKKLIIAYGFFGFGYIVTATFIVAIVRRLEHSELVESSTWVVVGLLAAPSILIWQHIARRLGMFPALRLAYALEAVGVLLAGFGASHVALVTGGALLGATMMGITALGLLAAREVAGSNQDKAIGWMTASFGLGQLLGPAVAGHLAHMTRGFGAPSLLAALLLIAGIALLRKT